MLQARPLSLVSVMIRDSIAQSRATSEIGSVATFPSSFQGDGRAGSLFKSELSTSGLALCVSIALHEMPAHQAQMGFTQNRDPLVGPVTLPDHEGQYISAGFSGHGMSRAFSCAEAVADMMLAHLDGKPAPAWPEWLPNHFREM